MTNCPWGTGISSPSFQSHCKAHCTLCDQRYMKLLLFPSLLLVSVYRKMCVVTKAIRRGKVGGPPLAL